MSILKITFAIPNGLYFCTPHLDWVADDYFAGDPFHNAVRVSKQLLEARLWWRPYVRQDAALYWWSLRGPSTWGAVGQGMLRENILKLYYFKLCFHIFFPHIVIICIWRIGMGSSTNLIICAEQTNFCLWTVKSVLILKRQNPPKNSQM